MFLSIFIEISSCMTDQEQNVTWHSFLRQGAYAYDQGRIGVIRMG